MRFGKMSAGEAAAALKDLGAAASGTNADIKSLVSPELGSPTMATQATADNSTKGASTAYADRAAALARSTLAKCRLIYSSATALLLAPYQGNQIWVNEASRTIPSAGITLANTGLAYGTLYYVYAVMSGAALVLEASTTGHATDATYGHEIKSGDSTRSLVGMIYTDGSSGTGTFADGPTKRWVATWFNRRTSVLSGASTGAVSTATQSPAELNASARVSWVQWADDVADLSTIGQAWSNAANSYQNVCTGIDSSTGAGVSVQSIAPGANEPLAMTSITKPILSEGGHYASPFGWTNANTASYVLQIIGSVRQ